MVWNVCTPKRLVGWLVALAVAAMLVVASPAIAASEQGAMAWYGGELIDLSHGWQGAEACHFGPDPDLPGVCFNSESAMDSALAVLVTRDVGGYGTMSSSCSSSLRLYDGTGYSGASLNLTSRGTWHNLSSYGFDQRTSSFKVGACAAKFTDYANGGGPAYPLSHTQAYDQSSSMLSGWDNDVSSVYIY